MDELKKRLSQKKRHRTQSPIKSELNNKQKYVLNNEKTEYFITLKLLEKSKIIIKCYPQTSQAKYEANFQLEELREKNRHFNVCNNIEEAYKILMNLLNDKKAKVVEQNNDSINLIIFIHSYIDNIDENISFNLVRILNNNDRIHEDLDPQNMANNIIKNTQSIDIEYDFMQKLNDLMKKSLEQETKIEKIIIYLNRVLGEVKQLKRDIKKIKSHIGMYDNSEKEEENDEDEEDEDKEDENKDLEEEEKEYRFNNEENQEYRENKDETQNLREKLKHNIMKLSDNKNNDKKGDKDDKEILQSPETQIISINSNNLSNNFPKLSFCKYLTKKTTTKYYGDNNFTVFESINKEIILVYSICHCSILFYDIEHDILLNNIKEAHKAQITNFRYVRDKNNNRDLLLSVSDTIKNIKIWDIKNYNCILNIEKTYYDGFLFSACFLIDEINKKGYIISVNYNSEPLKIFNLEGKNIRKINNCEDQSYMVDSYYNSYQRKYYIIVGNENFIISYNFEKGDEYKKYYDNTANKCLHMFFIINCKEKDVYLIEADFQGYVRIWNFDTGVLLKKFLIGQKLKLRGICLWDDNYLYVGASDKTVKLIDLKNGEILDTLKCGESVCTIKKINSPKYGECLLLLGKSNNGQIKLWKNIN
jgi:WD40 repeat protein